MAELHTQALAWIDALAKRSKRVLRPEETAAISRLPFKTRRLHAEDYFAHEGDGPAPCAYVEEGALYQSKLTRDGARQIVGLRLQREFVGLPGLFLHRSDHDVQALTACRLIEVAAPAVRDLAEAHPALAQMLLTDALVAGSIAQDWIINVGRRDAYCRVAHLLCELALRIAGGALSSGATYVLPLNQQQLGDAVGLGRVAVNRVLRDLTRAKLVQHDRSCITILDTQRLEVAGDFSARYLHLGQSERDRRRTARAEDDAAPRAAARLAYG